MPKITSYGVSDRFAEDPQGSDPIPEDSPEESKEDPSSPGTNSEASPKPRAPITKPKPTGHATRSNARSTDGHSPTDRTGNATAPTADTRSTRNRK